MNSIRTRIDLFWPVLIIVVAVFWLLRAAGSLPLAIIDLSDRALPIVLVALGLALVVGRRIPYAYLVVTGLCVILVGGVVVAAYNQQGSKLSSAYQRLLNEPPAGLPMTVKSIKISITTLATELEVQPAQTGQRTLSGTFEGSQESRVALDFTQSQDGASGAYTLVETRAGGIPLLSSVGKAKLILQLPAGVAISELDLNGGEGDVIFDASTSLLTTLNLTMGSGGINVKVPDKPGFIGTITTGQGDITLEIPASADAQIDLLGGGAANPDFNSAVYLITRDNVLKPQRNPNAPKMEIKLETGGKITVK